MSTIAHICFSSISVSVESQTVSRYNLLYFCKRIFQLPFKKLTGNMKITIKIRYFSLVNVVILVWTISLWFIPTSGQFLLLEALTSDFLPICCEKDSSYMIGFDVCESKVEHEELIRPQITKATEDNDEIDIEYDSFFYCGDGLVANISMNFRMLENGSLLVLSPVEFLIEEEFCIDEIQTMNPKESTALVARYCAPDPCTAGRECIPKCCPHGMVLYEREEYEFLNFQCQKMGPNHSSNRIQLRNEDGVKVLTSKLKEIPIIRDGAAPECSDELFDFAPDSGEYFSILPNGSMFLPSDTIGEIEPDQYCVDHLLKDNGTLVRDTHYNFVYLYS